MVFLLAYKKNLSPIRIVLAGVAVNAMLTALTNITTQFGAGAVSSIQSWLTGSLANITWMDIKLLLVYSIFGYIGAFLLYKSCDLISLGEKNAKSLGLKILLQYHINMYCSSIFKFDSYIYRRYNCICWSYCSTYM